MAEILITGVGMPKSCEYKDDEGNNRICFMFNSCTFRDCPLVEVPPHGDLIDRDSLAKQTKIDICKTGDDYDDMWKAIYDAPTVIPASKGEI